ncbi:DUF523 domain-containing protein [Paenibacillus sp. CAA11]|uniref:DUF523 domain-containing protein n=1 Tax=Paenibacillus sp. CAA11 TaxID=1532905 RepID=UPI000D342940|nr:DUF523 domain-containing protein [Paenibacillus sp. CAA11]AWB46487.1 DUF523 domain-containing protein [Paenibacillus sp. CAA11]
MILVSSCLAGSEVRYNGTHSLDERIQTLVREKRAVMVCPELLGGFSTPREPAEIVGGDGVDVLEGRARVVERSGRDVTELYIKGAYETLEMARSIQATIVVLKEYSPSCGSSMVYNGEFRNKKVIGRGVTTALLQRNGIQVISENDLAAWLAEGRV